MINDDEGMAFADVFRGMFAPAEHTQARLKAERRAGLTPKQRANRSVAKDKQINFRATSETKALVKALGEHLGKRPSDVLLQALETLAQSLPGFEAGKRRG
jgi:hypothetical protein